MKLHIQDMAQAEQLREAFLTRQPLTLTGAGVKVHYVASEMSVDYDPLPSVSLVLQQIDAAEWDGEGLPPVGIDCETLWGSTTGGYVAVRVIGHDEDRAVVRFTSGERKGEYDSDRQHNQYGYPIFRPIRTAEQIAAREREAAIEEMRRDTTVVGVARAIQYDQAERLYELGYRKQVQP